jgi:carbonic anhydrase
MTNIADNETVTAPTGDAAHTHSSDLLLARNAAFAQSFIPDATMMPALGAIVITCADPRVDPAHILGLQRGDALVIRNLGGRVTPATVQTIAMLGAIAQNEGVDPGAAALEVIVLQHTDCGITRLRNHPEALAESFGIDAAALDGKSIDDPRAAISIDLAALRTVLPAGITLTGLLYDVDSGQVERVAEPSPVLAG